MLAGPGKSLAWVSFIFTAPVVACLPETCPLWHSVVGGNRLEQVPAFSWHADVFKERQSMAFPLLLISFSNAESLMMWVSYTSYSTTCKGNRISFQIKLLRSHVAFFHCAICNILVLIIFFPLGLDQSQSFAFPSPCPERMLQPSATESQHSLSIHSLSSPLEQEAK